MFLEALLRILGALVALGFVLFLAWFVLQWLNKRMPGTVTGAGRMIQVLDRAAFGKNNHLILAKVDTKVFLLAFSEHSVETVAEFDDPDGKYTTAKPVDAPNFSAMLKDAAAQMGLKRKEHDQKPEENTDETPDDPEGGKE